MPLSSTESKTYRIYALIDTITGVVHYVGQTAGTLGHRRMDHVRKRGDTRKGEWIRSLLEVGLEPEIDLLEEFVGYRSRAYQRETYWIRRLRSEGHPLLNV